MMIANAFFIQVMMLWVNLIMDTMGALALGTEEPTLELLQRLVAAVITGPSSIKSPTCTSI